MGSLLTHSTSLPLCRTGTGMCFCYSLEPPCQPDTGCHWEKSLDQIPSGSAESDRRGQKGTFKSDLCTNSTVGGNLNERTADNLTWQQHSIPILSSTNEFRESEKTQVMNHFHYAYTLIRLGLSLALHSGEYKMQEELGGLQKVGQKVHRFITNIAPSLVLLSLSEDILHFPALDTAWC